MSIGHDLETIGDLIGGHGTEADRRAWLRVRAHLDDQRRRLEVAHETLRLTGGGREEPRREDGTVDVLRAIIPLAEVGLTHVHPTLRGEHTRRLRAAYEAADYPGCLARAAAADR